MEVLVVYQTRVAKLFKNGASQAVRLPVEFRFEGSEVYVTRNEVTGDVVLSNQPGAKAWRDFFEMAAQVDASDEFMKDRPMNRPPIDRNLFFTQKA